MSKITHHPQVIWDQVDGKTVICHLDTAEFFYMNSISARVWQICNGCSVDNVVEHIYASSPQGDYEQLKLEIQQFILSLEAAGLVEQND